MIELITGLPRSGKTSLLVHRLMTHKDFEGRSIYVSGIPELNIGNDNIHIIDEGGDSKPVDPDQRVDNWQDWLPDSSILVVDECQRFFRPRAVSASVPPHVAALETHGHREIDIIFITQHPRLIDSNVKSFVERHQNIKMTTLGVRNLQEWSRCANPDSASDCKEAMSSVFKVKTDSFNKYKSAVGHAKMEKKRHWIFYFAMALIPIVPLALWFAYYSYSSATDQFTKEADIPKQEKTQTATNSTFTGSMGVNNQIIKGSVPADYVPTVSERPETKPLYDGVRQVVNFEFPDACISSKTKCTCYSNQATPIKEIPEAFCREYVNNGVFNPYKQAETKMNTTVTPNSSSSGKGDS